MSKYLKQFLISPKYQGSGIKTQFYNDIESLAKDYGTESTEKYYELVPIENNENFKEAVCEALQRRKDEEKATKKLQLEHQIKKLQDELEELEKE